MKNLRHACHNALPVVFGRIGLVVLDGCWLQGLLCACACGRCAGSAGGYSECRPAGLAVGGRPNLTKAQKRSNTRAWSSSCRQIEARRICI